MTRHVKDADLCPFGHTIRRGSSLHPHRTRHHPIAHDLDVLIGQAERGEPYDLTRKIHHRDQRLDDPARHGGHSKAPVRKHRR
jgi:hypothetical protein